MRASSLRNEVHPVNVYCLKVPVVFQNISLSPFHYARDGLSDSLRAGFVFFLFPEVA